MCLDRLKHSGLVQVEEICNEVVWMHGFDLKRSEYIRRKVFQVKGHYHGSAALNCCCQDVTIIWIREGEPWT
ncbi:hypothetical protein CSB93_2770 [Pseudomonas paraeruginosa]|uniref:Uncharacterized protein n=1 Tax=Pseudomonas paraeruginosa TaxID=2994495 RepID=A0A2R3J0U8_9PSED|nr:hypothetical protein CSB93_2770 [Pseudomonas paraeruginosa]AWE94469.1 hypothetical protein CSC28_1541 [Pseudomonas paraeruginosa]